MRPGIAACSKATLTVRAVKVADVATVVKVVRVTEAATVVEVVRRVTPASRLRGHSQRREVSRNGTRGTCGASS